MERPLKNKVSSFLALLTACQLGLGLIHAEGKADVAPGSSAGSAPADTALTVDALRRRGAELDNFIYEASDVSDASVAAGRDSTQARTKGFRPKVLWIAAGAACLVGIGTAWLVLASEEKKVTYTDYEY